MATSRERIVDTQKRLLVPIKEFEEVGNVEMAKLLSKSIKKTMDALEKDMRQISLKKFVQANQKVEEVSKQLTGWQKFIKN